MERDWWYRNYNESYPYLQLNSIAKYHRNVRITNHIRRLKNETAPATEWNKSEKKAQHRVYEYTVR